MPGVTVTLMIGDKNITTTTDKRGNYSFSGLGKGSYMVTPGKTGYTFSPGNKAVTVKGADVTGQDFTGRVMTYSISGTVRDCYGLGVSGVTVTLEIGRRVVTITTDSNGNYWFYVPNGNYLITPSNPYPSIYYVPANRSVTVDGADITGLDFDEFFT